MDTSKIVLFLLLFIPVTAFSGVGDFTGQSNYFRNSAGTFIKSSEFASDLANGKLRSQVPFQFNTSKGTQLVPITRDATVSTSRLGSAVTKFAKKVGPVAMTLATVDLICELSDICNNAGEWFTGTEFEQLNEAPNCSNVQVGETVFWTNAFDRTFEYKRQGTTTCEVAPPGYGFIFACAESTSGCFNGERVYQKDLGLAFNFPDPLTPATEQDFNAAEPALNDDRFIDPLFQAGEDIPVDQPDPFPPENTLIGTKTETLRDSAGNITGTKVTDTTLKVDDASTATQPNNFNITETTTVTNFDVNNTVIDSSTTVEDSTPSPEPAEEEPVTFDEVTDVDLEQKEVTAVLDTTSWGSGSCPAPIAIDTSFGNYQLDSQPFCDFATALKPMIVLVALILGAFIILRARKT